MEKGKDYSIQKADQYMLGRLAMGGFLPQSGSLLLDRDAGWVASDAVGPVAALVGRPAVLYHTLIVRGPLWVAARLLIERARGWQESAPGAPKTSLFQIAPGNDTMGRLAIRLGATMDPGQLWRIDL